MSGRVAFYLFGASLLFIALVALVLGRRNSDASKKAWMPFFAAGILFIVWGACGGFYAIYTFTDRVQAHRSLDPDAVVALELLPGRYPEITPPLVPQRLVVTDRQEIGQVTRALKAAEPWSASHPRATWECILWVDDGTRKHSYIVSSTTNNGVLIDMESGGLLVGEYREDSLKEILERIATGQGDK
jgi:hypothetical protein